MAATGGQVVRNGKWWVTGGLVAATGGQAVGNWWASGA